MNGIGGHPVHCGGCVMWFLEFMLFILGVVIFVAIIWAAFLGLLIVVKP